MQMFQTTNQHGVKFIDEMGYPRTSDMILSGTYMLPRHLNSHSRIYESRDDNPTGSGLHRSLFETPGRVKNGASETWRKYQESQAV